MNETLEGILKEVHQIRDQIKDVETLENFRVKFLGRKGLLANLADELKSLDDEKKKKFGYQFNLAKKEIESVYEELKQNLVQEPKVRFSFRHPGQKPLVGHLSPISLALNQAIKIFTNLGFKTILGSEIENEYYNFDALNIPADHPARDLWDTFWLDQKKEEEVDKKNQRSKKNKNKNTDRYLLRTHTSPSQVHYLEKNFPPFRIIIPGKVFRYEATDKTHEFEFHQLEGLAIGAGANLAELKGVLEKFFSEFYKKNLKIRLRPAYFPFVEPGLEFDVECIFCLNQKKKGCAICKQSGFIEIGGAGMVHPFVFKSVGLDSSKNYGYAFGLGLERIIMIRYKINDIRLFHSNDKRFIEQF
ncbi:MAG: phenylalanine--tRNA ligase subunit alpha [Patescibacteria group bacterium]|nr:phenylalanine--tRNA ligase subunit alpha [Patescibacteria group bacterium]